jgi:hypothetical protein
MRKQISKITSNVPATAQAWLDLENIAAVELTSEDQAFPIESALLGQGTVGWRAAEPGVQTIRVIFEQPQRLKRISLVFVETEAQRTQEFTLKWSPDRGNSFQEIVRQQWNFSPPTTIRETEEYQVDLPGVTALELTIVPDISGGTARASVKSLRVS